MFNLRLRRFWADAGTPGAFFPRLVERAIGEPVRVVGKQGPVDLEIVEGSPRTRDVLARRARVRMTAGRRLDPRWAEQDCIAPEHRKSIWYTAENVRPPSRGDWSGFLSFDLDSLSGRNAYLPLWVLDLADFNAAGDLTVSSLTQSRPCDIDRSRFVCAFIGNPDSMRFHAITALSELGPVDVYGGSVGRHVADKWRVARQYRYILCFENDLYPGYITEKALDGARSSCVPLYRGLDPSGSLNPDGMLTWNPPSSLEDLVNSVADLESNAERRATMLEAPVLLSPPKLDSVVELIQRVVDG